MSFNSQTPLVCSVAVDSVTILAAGTCTVQATQAGNANYAAAAPVDQGFTIAMATLTVTADPETIAFDDPAPAYTFTYGTFQGTDDAGDIDTPATCTSPYVQGDDAGGYTITCTGGADNNYTFSYFAGSLTVTKADQTVAFDGSAPAGAAVGGSATQTATATSGLTAVITVDAATTNSACSVTGGTTVNFLAAGTCVLAANQAGNGNWNAAPEVTRTFTIGQAAQTITFGALSDRPYGDVFAVSATASSGLSVSFSSQTTGVCTVSDATVTVVSTGTCTIRATQAGNGSYAPAPAEDRTFTATTRFITVTAVDRFPGGERHDRIGRDPHHHGGEPGLWRHRQLHPDLRLGRRRHREDPDADGHGDPRRHERNGALRHHLGARINGRDHPCRRRDARGQRDHAAVGGRRVRRDGHRTRRLRQHRHGVHGHDPLHEHRRSGNAPR